MHNEAKRVFFNKNFLNCRKRLNFDYNRGISIMCIKEWGITVAEKCGKKIRLPQDSNLQHKNDHRRTRTCNLLVSRDERVVRHRSQTRYHCAR